ncbi:hypothetical protein PILCRDRAFT_816592 [Piloderma croceum F 1598]|uniref:Uncharacterized protein n=1 Tax=Piloderma croceum (strain F 1598) TaxID=765440 RepID=A0A0C3G2G5_PILCF|nr:hypothetical protein PILCRDRAFT_816592 [Piloderma croceum F 1598]
MFRNLNSTLAAANAVNGRKTDKSMSPNLRSDIYAAMDQVKPWLTGDLSRARAGDGVSYSEPMNIIQKHFPETNMGLDSIGNTEGETSVVVSGITNMILELSKWDGMMSGLAMKSWAKVLEEAYGMAAAANPGSRTESIRNGISMGVEMTDATLMTKEFAVRLLLVSLLKNINSKLYGAGSAEARRGDALWSSRFI